MVIDLSIFNINAIIFIWLFKIISGLIVFFATIFIIRFLFFSLWLPSRQKKYLAGVNFILLAIDIPKENEQSPKAVEHIFSTLAGMLGGGNMYEKYWLGIHQLSLSMEIVSLEGYIQFYVYLPEKFKDMVEAAFYAQYPEAEITIAEDYTNLIPNDYPNEYFDLWGSDFKLAKENAYPIRTYPNFEHSLTQELKDPMASLLEVFSRIGSGEYIWLQWIITPVNDSWKQDSENMVKKLIGAKVEAKADFGYYVTYPFLAFMKWLGDILVVTADGKADENIKKTDNDINKLLYLTEGEREVVKAIEEKMSKIGFASKSRLIYAARREVFNKAKGVNPVIGALNQFSALNMNSFTKVKTTTTVADYFMVEKRIAARQNRIINAYKTRDGGDKFGSKPFILNIEELATVYHFPGITVKAPAVKTTEAKRSEPPVSLPTQNNNSAQENIFVKVEDIPTTKSQVEDKSFEENNMVLPKKEEVKVILPDLPDDSKNIDNIKNNNEIKITSETNKKKDSPPPNLPV